MTGNDVVVRPGRFRQSDRARGDIPRIKIGCSPVCDQNGMTQVQPRATVKAARTRPFPPPYLGPKWKRPCPIKKLVWTPAAATAISAAMPSAASPDYQVVLDAFRGPLDLLLYLVKREEVDVRDIPVARVNEQFKEYLDVLTLIDVERAGDFLVTAATLMEIKSKLLLPRVEESDEAEEDPRRQLVRQLIQYKRFKDAAVLLESQGERHALRLARQPAPAGASNAPQRLRPVELWDLVSAFGRLMRETMTQQTHDVVVDQTPLHVYIGVILDRLRAEPRLPFAALFTPPHTRGRLVGLFLGVLELTKQRRIIPEQAEPFAEIWVSLAPEAAAPTDAIPPAPPP